MKNPSWGFSRFRVDFHVFPFIILIRGPGGIWIKMVKKLELLLKMLFLCHYHINEAGKNPQNSVRL